MKTSCFSRYLSTGRISIARYAPRNTPAGYRMYKPLARGAGFNSVSTSRYIELYESEVLGRPDARQVWNELHAMAGGQEPVLLCRRSPASSATASWWPGGSGANSTFWLMNTIPAPPGR